jgi:transposase
MIGTDTIGLVVESTAHQASCPMCQEESTEVHSTYMRYPVDLAWGEWRIVLHLRVKRFFCRNDACQKRTFAEQFPGLVARYARRTERVITRQQQVGVNVSARTAETLLALAQIGVSDTTVNRLIRDLPEPEVSPIRVLGVDDWAKRKGRHYGTLLVDLERGQVIDLLGDRIEAVFKILQQEYAVIKKKLDTGLEQDDCKIELPETSLPVEPERLTPAEERRKERMAKTQQLHRQGWTQKSIAHHLNIHPKTVRRYLQSPTIKSRRHRTGRLLDPFKPYVVQRWNEGCHNAMQIFREIEQQGFTGKPTIVRDFVRQLRKAGAQSHSVHSPKEKALGTNLTKLPSLRSLTRFILKRPEQQSEDEEKVLTHIGDGQPKLTTTINLAREFAAIVRQRQVKKLDTWLEQASKSEYPVWRHFAAGLKKDYAAVHAALTFHWSNGPTEGHINRLKCLKRQMYGRAKDDLLRKRLLWQGRWAFT